MSLKTVVLLFTIFMVATVLSCKNKACLNKRYPMPEDVPVPLKHHLSHKERVLHETKMQELIDYTKAKNAWFGSSIVHKNGTTVCYGVNESHQYNDPTLHGEMVVMHNCSKLFGITNYSNYTLYTTGESCPMCQSAAMWNKFSTIVYATSIETMYCDKCLGQILIDSNFLAAFGNGLQNGYVPPVIIGGILEDVTNREIFPDACDPNYELAWKVTPNCTKKHH
ncbi:hypothetical protein DICPUDRAFT_86189 [Dictyostelium purpureum]|uniref:CMP/dCMP-type deaminase domain-containing protein n=1 Tax=Dictyostelium purpureum TaxID=5786 RepID=F0ZA48_DICPU|nr:uncharacterized protein DICPUDRAFT_86189 [Dictyostelium purpureum]EGC39171.1 hypothetical protein DICPUDRAFT_86189 [Dictyostelium purpureum]|eukprot:XP_003284317.1 hypothetical protein DICPUDRAFT_86189 [Dictyostelium purpureum]